MQTKRRAIVWFRQDLRLHDNVALNEAINSAIEVIPVYIFDERWFNGETNFGFAKIGPHRTKFIIESIKNLRANLKRIDGELIVRVGKTEDILFELAKKAKSSWIFCNRERTADEVAVQDALEQKLWSIGQEIRFSRGKMLYHTADLPFPIQHVPDSFAQFRKETERYVPVREPLEVPQKNLAQLTVDIDPGEIPGMADFGFEDCKDEARSVLHFQGGESEGLKRLHYYLWETDLVQTYRKTQDEMLGGDYSTKLSPWLAQGCLSPKRVYHELKRYEAERGENKSTYAIFQDLLWRDFYRFMAKKHGDVIFEKGGIQGKAPVEGSNDFRLLQRWVDGETGIPFIDAHMKEIALTGYMSNRGRQNVASFLINDLQVNWQMGAEYFESILIDYDVTSNWGNWNYQAGVGSEVREDRALNIMAQAKRYDPHGEYVKHWLPELRSLPADKVHNPAALPDQERKAYNLNGHYANAIIDPRQLMQSS